MHEIKQKEEPVKIRIELQVFVRHLLSFVSRGSWQHYASF